MQTAIRNTLAAAAGTILAACATPSSNVVAPQDAFWTRLGALCGKAFEGRIAANVGAGAGPDAFTGKALVMHVRECSAREIRVPFHVGDNRSRTWVFTRTASGLRLKHDHRHEDGKPDELTMYGGDALTSGTASSQSFPVDEETRALFVRRGIPQSLTNTWVVGIEPMRTFSYGLQRPGRDFRVDFDLSKPVPAPPPPWGAR